MKPTKNQRNLELLRTVRNGQRAKSELRFADRLVRSRLRRVIAQGKAARLLLIEENSGLVNKTVSRLLKNSDTPTDRYLSGEVRSCCLAQFITSVDRTFDLDAGYAFSTHVMSCMFKKGLTVLQNSGRIIHIPSAKQSEYRSLVGGEEDDLSDITDGAKRGEELAKRQAMSSSRGWVSLYAPQYSGAEEVRIVADVVEDTSIGDPSEQFGFAYVINEMMGRKKAELEENCLARHVERCLLPREDGQGKGGDAQRLASVSSCRRAMVDFFVIERRFADLLSGEVTDADLAGTSSLDELAKDLHEANFTDHRKSREWARQLCIRARRRLVTTLANEHRDLLDMMGIDDDDVDAVIG